MAGRRKAPLWRQAFLRALRRTGNVRTSAFEAGVDPGTAYDHRAKDAGFRGKWAGALKAFKTAEARNPPSRKAMADQGEELVLRRSKDGDKMVRAAAGRWSRRVEESFLDGLEATGSVTAAAAAVGMSTAALYKRRDKYPEFRARWDERVGRFQEQLPALINAAAVQSMEPELPGAKRRGRARLPRLAPGEAIHVYAINENAKAKARGPARRGGVSSQDLRPQRSEAEEHEELAQTLEKLIGMAKRRREAERLAAGWTDCGNGIWVPPGWTARPPSPEASADQGPDGPPTDPPSP